MACLEVYNEVVYDLLSQREKRTLASTGSVDHYGDMTHVRGLRKEPVTSLAEAHKLFQVAASFRKQGSTEANARSSRSHAVYRLYVSTKDGRTVIGYVCCHNCMLMQPQEKTSYRVFNLVDLAGSESLDK